MLCLAISAGALQLNCPCHLHRSIYLRMHNWAPHRLVYSKVYVDMENLFLFYFCLCDLFVKIRRAAPCYARSIHWKKALAPGQFSNCAILSHTMTGKNRHTSFVNRLNFKSCISHSVSFQQLLYSESAESIGQTHSKFFPVIVYERIARFENCPGARASFQWIDRA